MTSTSEQYDFTLERDSDAKRFLLTAITSKGRDFLEAETAASSEWWGKSLIVKRHEVDGLLERIFSVGLEVNMKGEAK